MKQRWLVWFGRERKRAVRLLEHPLEVLRAADQAADKAQSARGPLGRVWNDLQTSVRLARAWARRDYRDVRRSTLVLLVAGLLYLVCPIDAIVDAIPVIGFIDDAAVLAFVLGQVRSELQAFRDWEQRRQLAPA